MSEITPRRENGRRRPKGYADWCPQTKTRALLGQVGEILDEYEDYLPLTVRQIFYRLVGAFDYEKTEQAYDRLAEMLVRARRARLIPFEHIRDDGTTLYPVMWYGGVEDFHNETARQAREYRRDRQAFQNVRIELWCEAAGMAPQLARVAHAYSIPVRSSGGFSSLTAVREIVDRARNRDMSTVLLHVGDYDPSGVSIFEAIADDAAAFMQADRLIASQEIIAERVALTAEQVDEYELPTAPAKRSDSRSATWQGGTCQLEALAPDDLATIVRDAILSWLDIDDLARILEIERLERAELLGLPRGGGESTG
jgi:hypothetical protein